jgi:hypothetical protein
MRSASPSRSGRVTSARPPQAPECLRDRLERGHHVLRNPVAQHHLARKLVVRLRLEREVLDERHGHVDRRHVGSRMGCHQRDQAKVVDVLVGEDHELELLERMAYRRDSPLERVERGAGVRPGVHQRQRPVLDQVDVYPADREGVGMASRWIPAPRRRQRVVAGERRARVHGCAHPYWDRWAGPVEGGTAEPVAQRDDLDPGGRPDRGS